MSLEQLEDKFTKYEIARILGARALQISMDAPLLIKMSESELEEINFNPLEIAKRELISEVLPITVNRPMPKKTQEKIKVLTKQETEDIKKKEEEAKEVEEAKISNQEEVEEKKGEEEIKEDSEIMELATPDDEIEESSEESSEEV